MADSVFSDSPAGEALKPPDELGLHRGLQPQKVPGRTVIAHISDLHLAPEEVPDQQQVWQRLRSHLQGSGADLLLVTGDVIESPAKTIFRTDPAVSALEEAKSYLHSLCQDLSLEPRDSLVVLPGNHDVRLRGVGPLREPVLTQFREVFREESRSRLLEGLGVCLLTFDSNPRGGLRQLATGLVESEEFTRLLDQYKWILENYGDEWHRATRIALLHHHPMPIAATQMDPEEVVGAEQFMLLQNAGPFMHQMIRCGVDLVLHGHRHYPSVSKARFRVESSLNREITIVGAGSVGAKDDHPYSYNLITIEANGEIELRRFDRTDVVYEEAVPSIYLRAYDRARDEWRARMAKRPNARLRIKRRVITFRIQPSGDAIRTSKCESAIALAEPVDRLPRSYKTASGYVMEPKFESLTSGQPAPEFRENEDGRTEIYFSKAIGDQPISWQSRLEVLNAIHFNAADRQEALLTSDEESMGGEVKADTEEFGTRTYQLADHLLLAVYFPDRKLPREVGVRVRGQSRRQAGREQRHAEQFLSTVESEGMALLSLPKPLPGFRYSIEWKLPESEKAQLGLKPEYLARAQEVAERLSVAAEPGGARHDAVLECLRRVHTEVAGLSENQEAADLAHVALFLGEEKKGLRCAFSVGGEEVEQQLHQGGVQCGRTIVGQAYRRREYAYFVQLEQHQTGASRYFDPQEDLRPLHEGRVVGVAVPLVYPVVGDDPLEHGLRLGVLWLGVDDLLSTLVGYGENESLKLALPQWIMGWWARDLVESVLEVRPPGSQAGPG